MPLDINALDSADVQQHKAPSSNTPDKEKKEVNARRPNFRNESKSAERDKNEFKKKRKKHRRGNKAVDDKRNAKSDDKSQSDHTGHPSKKDKKHHKRRGDGSKFRSNNKNEFPKKSPIYSAIDLGTNNCRLLIAKQTRKGFRVIDAFSRIVRLGEGVARDNRLSEEAMDRTIEALKVCAEKLARRNVTCMRHVATEACRIADNSDQFVERVRLETGINLDVISPGEEARLAVLGCQSLIASDKKNALVFDIGGGSTELIWVAVRPGRRNKIMGWMSVPWGVVNLTEEFSNNDGSISPDKYSEMMDAVGGHLAKFDEAHKLQSILKGRTSQFLGTSGTVTTVASLHLKLPKYVRDRVDGAWMRSEEVIALSRKIAEMTPEERADEPCIGEERSNLVVAGCAILEAILGRWDVPSLRVADRGIREGILRGLMQIDAPPKTPRRRSRRRRGSGPKKAAE